MRFRLDRTSRALRRLFFILICALVGIAVARLKRNEVAQAEADTLNAAHKIQNLNNWKGGVAQSPILALEFHVRGTLTKEDFRNYYYGQVDVGMYRLRQFGVLDERRFRIEDATALVQFVSSISSRGSNVLWRVMDLGDAKWFGGFSQDFLWHVKAETNGTVTVVAKPSEMIAWKRLIETAARTNQSVPIVMP